MRQVILRSNNKRRVFRHYIYEHRGLPIELRQHLLQELIRLRSGEISYILITAEGQDARFKNEILDGENTHAI